MAVRIWWIRRDLRLHDNPALRQAAQAEAMIPLFILDPALLALDAPKRQAFLFDGLRALRADLEALGSRLIVRRGEPKGVLSQLVAESGAESISAAEDLSPYARRRDARVAAGLPLRLTAGVTVQPPAAVLKPDGSAYTVFTPFSKAWKALPLAEPLRPLQGMFPPAPVLASDEIPFGETHPGFPAGEAEALRRLDVFLDGPVAEYAEGRNRLDLEGTSALSPYFRFGMLSPRLAAWRVMQAAAKVGDAQARRGCEIWLNELIWREFYNAILYHFPHVLKMAFNPALREIPWRDDADDLRAWQQGRTGYPVVDACMRQLAATGWMHNRGRMIVASFLTKDLLLNWQDGEAWFMRHLLDGDP
ncbi:MAG TPA: deoxyribodipyrimidine photo-lyase, partial [Anaerolinea sp.]|nr:deoxyribodipyrimidine photo-lyase [Anaerolinea sp.]